MSVSLLLALWVSILQALAGTPAGRPRTAVAHQVRPAAETSVLRSDPSPAHDALRVARVVTGVVPATAEGPTTHLTLSTPLGAPPRLPVDPLGATDTGERALRASHAVAARGAVLPYFATAPPLQG